MKRKRIRRRRLAFEQCEGRMLLAFDVGSLAPSLNADNLENVAPEVTSDDAPVRFRIDVSDGAGLPLTTVAPGDEFTVSVFVVDQRPSPQGVFAAYLDLNYDDERVERAGAVEFGSAFPNVQNDGGSASGQFDEIGAAGSLLSLLDFQNHRDDLEGVLLFKTPFRAIESGPISFRADPADQFPSSDVLLFGIDQGITPEQIQFDSLALDVATTSFDSPAVSNNPIVPELGLSGQTRTPIPPANSTRVDFSPLVWRHREQGDSAFDRRAEATIEVPHVAASLTHNRTVKLRDENRTPHTPESTRPRGGYIELELPANRLPRRVTSAWQDSATWQQRNLSAEAEHRQPSIKRLAFGTEFQRIYWEELTWPNRRAFPSSNWGMIDIAEIAYETILADGWLDEEIAPGSSALADEETAEDDDVFDADSDAEAIDTLFALGVELKTLRGSPMAIEFAHDDEEGGAHNCNDMGNEKNDQVDAGPPQPGSERHEKPHTKTPT